MKRSDADKVRDWHQRNPGFVYGPPVTRRSRFVQVLTLLCGEKPPKLLVDRWIAHDEEHVDETTLQDWAANHLPFEWAMGITTIETAEFLADSELDANRGDSAAGSGKWYPFR